ncbi:hypothetical protein PXH66_00110 [Synoicihabitans lomoniglobus]|uniref:YcxB-like protein domain-containing protein n=1 Tax=Synoicihabitans lomoniglobus TaxID=2909285 RepID=A0AAF0CNY3_9BACT|nr:hypothetical protein PXH66_00110 [Opitutaceae bacterium LMO-M01]
MNRSTIMEFRAEIEFTPDDAVIADRMHRHHSPHARKAMFAGAVLLSSIFGFIALRMNFPVIGFLGIALGLILVSSIPLYERLVRKAARNGRKEKLSVHLTERGAHLWDSREDYSHTWDIVPRARLDERGVLLYLDTARYLFIPARAWHGGYRREDMKAFFQTVIKKSNKSPETRTTSGPVSA